MMQFFYTLILILLGPILWALTAQQAYKRGGGWRFFCQRAGFSGPPTKKATVWFHAASVGEVMAIMPVLAYWAEHKTVLLTTNTPESGRIATARLGQKIEHRYCPLDYAWAIDRLINAHSIQQLIVVETELWPNLFAACARHDIRIAIANGRISTKTLNANRLVRALYRSLFAHVDIIWARSTVDAERYHALGATKSSVEVLGNIKFAVSKSTAELVSPPGRPYVLAVSTHDDEEQQLASLWQDMLNRPLLVIIPRHPPRGQHIVLVLRQRGFVVAQRSKQEQVTDATDFYIADTLGEVAGFARFALWSFIGGSLVPVGGHNMLELAALGNAVVSGPYLDNFNDESQYLRAQGGLVIVDSVEQLKQQCEFFVSNPAAPREIARNAAQAMEKAASVLASYQRALHQFID